MKSATTSLCDVLNGHPDVFICEPKEPEFFCRDADIKDYAALFENARLNQIVGEGSTSYTKVGAFAGVAQRIAQVAPNAKLIYIMRDPIRRIESHWMHAIRSGHKSINRNRIQLDVDSNYVDTSLYWRQIAEYRKHFEDTQFLLLLFEDFKNDSEAVLSRCWDFLGLEYKHDKSDGDARHVSLGSVVDRPVVGRLQKVDLVRKLFQLLPRNARDVLKRPFQQTVISRPNWDPECLEQVLERVAPDARCMLEFMGRSADVWPLEVNAYLGDKGS